MSNQAKEMSLHRIIAEIKAAEAKLSTLNMNAFVFTVPVDSAEDTVEGKRQSQANFDKIAALLTNLATLKAARNLKNATTEVTIAGVKMTIDAALARKSANVYQLQFLNTLRAQMNAGKTRVDQVQAQIEAKIAQQVTAASTGTKKATEEEIKVFRGMAERNTKLEVVAFDGLKGKIDTMAAELEQFATEVDYVLSEANATTKVEVTLA
jgi:hypothetical protein